jgi:HAD superfamily hydrolase (TIGR01459 family)
MAAQSGVPQGPLVVAGLSDLAGDFDIILCDIWGVIHNGVTVFPRAVEALRAYRNAGGIVILVSNAPRPLASVKAQLAGLGFASEASDAVLTSGDITRGLIMLRAGQKLLHIGPERDLPLFAGLDAPFGTLSDSRYAVCTGLENDDTETADDYAAQLAAMAATGLPMICANPDLMVDRGGRNIPCAGAIGAAYEALGGEVVYPGKPYPAIYEHAMQMAAALKGMVVKKARVLAIGDSIRTDIAGASRFGIASLMVLNGIHAHEVAGLDVRGVEAWLARQEHVADKAVHVLAW